MMSPAVCAGPTCFRFTALSPTDSCNSSENVRVGGGVVMSRKSNAPKQCKKNSPISPISGACSMRLSIISGFSCASSSAVAADIMMSAPCTNSLPLQWSPFECVFTSWPMLLAALGSAARMRSSMVLVSGLSNSVSTRSDSSPSTISPALLHPQPPSGCSHA